MADSNSNAPIGSPGGFKSFNNTGRDDTTTQVLRPQRSAQANKNRLVLIAVAIAAIFLLGFIAFQRSGLSLFPSSNEEGGHSFAPGAQNVEASQ
jgi:hypothetical protein